jgi:hypothetical protein
MATLLDRLRDTLKEDDLYWRVSCFVFALLAIAVGAFIACILLLSSARETMWWLWYGLFWLLATAFFAWGLVLLGGCVSPPDSRPARWAASVLPGISGPDLLGDSSGFFDLLYYPAAVLTLLLRSIGVRGCKSSRSAEIMDEAERNTGSPWP